MRWVSERSDEDMKNMKVSNNHSINLGAHGG